MSDSQGEPEANPRARFRRYDLAIVACAAWLAVYGGGAVMLFIRVCMPVHDWVDRQPWLLANLCAAGLWVFYFAIAAIGWAVTLQIWKSVVGAPDPPDPDPTGGEAGRCPKCGFGEQWDGTTCGHCGYRHSRWKKGTTLDS